MRVEDYAKAIYDLSNRGPDGSASTGELAKRLGVSPGSVTSMLRTLRDAGLANYQAYGGVRLSDAGRKLALRVLRRHRLIELFLQRTLGLTWDEVHEEAEHLEHAASDRLVDRIEVFLGYPQRDPHGAPIPDSNGSVQPVEATPLADCPPGTGFTLERVVGQSPELLRYLSEAKLGLGRSGVVVENHPSAGAVTVRSGELEVSLGREVAGKLLVETSDSDRGDQEE